eukprot:SAG31_NODE_3424_length_4291_cov_1.659113_3_plen_88_part_00
MALILAHLMSASPPDRIDSSTAPGGASRTARQVGNAAFSEAKALWEFTSVVFCRQPHRRGRPHRSSFHRVTTGQRRKMTLRELPEIR